MCIKLIEEDSLLFGKKKGGWLDDTSKETSPFALKWFCLYSFNYLYYFYVNFYSKNFPSAKMKIKNSKIREEIKVCCKVLWSSLLRLLRSQFDFAGIFLFILSSFFNRYIFKVWADAEFHSYLNERKLIILFDWKDFFLVIKVRAELKFPIIVTVTFFTNLKT